MSAGPKTCLLVVDVQRGLFCQRDPIFKGTELLDTINFLIAKARRSEVPVVFIQHSNKGILVEESENWLLHPDLWYAEGDIVFRKKHGSAFKETSLKGELDRLGIENLIVVGLTTHGCIRATCKDAVRLGYSVLLVADGHSSYAKNADELINFWNEKLSEILEVKIASEVGL